MPSLTNRQIVRYFFYFPLILFALGLLFYKALNPEWGSFFEKEPALIVAASPQPARQTFSPATLEAFIKKENPKVYSRLAREIVTTTLSAAKEYNLSAVLILSVMAAESEFNLNAVSKTGARGLMQIQPNHWTAVLQKQGILLSAGDIHDPQQNIRAGCYILRHYLDEEKSFERALSRYLGADSASYRSRVNYFLGEILCFSVQREINAPYQAQLLQQTKPLQKPLEAGSALKIPSTISVPVSVP